MMNKHKLKRKIIEDLSVNLPLDRIVGIATVLTGEKGGLIAEFEAIISKYGTGAGDGGPSDESMKRIRGALAKYFSSWSLERLRIAHENFCFEKYIKVMNDWELENPFDKEI